MNGNTYDDGGVRMDYTMLAHDNDFQKWFKYQPLDAQIVRYAKKQPSVIAAGQKIMDVYNAFANAKQSFRAAGYDNYGDLCGDDEISKLYTRYHFLMCAIMEYNTCRDLCLQVIWAYIQPSSIESLVQNQYRDIERECNSEKVHKRFKELIKEGRSDLESLKKLLTEFENDKSIKVVQNLCNYIKHRGTVHFEGLGDNFDTMLLTVNGQVVRTLGRPSYTFEEIEDVLWNYHKDFQRYFNQIVDMIIPEGYMDNRISLEDYISTLLKMIKLQNKKM